MQCSSSSSYSADGAVTFSFKYLKLGVKKTKIATMRSGAILFNAIIQTMRGEGELYLQKKKFQSCPLPHQPISPSCAISQTEDWHFLSFFSTRRYKMKLDYRQFSRGGAGREHFLALLHRVW